MLQLRVFFIGGLNRQVSENRSFTYKVGVNCKANGVSREISSICENYQVFLLAPILHTAQMGMGYNLRINL